MSDVELALARSAAGRDDPWAEIHWLAAHEADQAYYAAYRRLTEQRGLRPVPERQENR